MVSFPFPQKHDLRPLDVVLILLCGKKQNLRGSKLLVSCTPMTGSGLWGRGLYRRGRGLYHWGRGLYHRGRGLWDGACVPRRRACVPRGRGLCPGAGPASALLAVLLADVAQRRETVQVVQTPVLMKVGAVLVSVTQAVARPAVRLTRAPPPATRRRRRAWEEPGGGADRLRAHLRSMT